MSPTSSRTAHRVSRRVTQGWFCLRELAVHTGRVDAGSHKIGNLERTCGQIRSYGIHGLRLVRRDASLMAEAVYSSSISWSATWSAGGIVGASSDLTAASCSMAAR